MIYLIEFFALIISSKNILIFKDQLSTT